MIRGSPSTVSWLSVSPGSDPSISARCSSARSSRVAQTTVRTMQVLERAGTFDLGAQHGEELVELADPQRLEQHVLAPREQPVERGPRDPAVVGDVVDGDLVEAPSFAAPLRRIEDAVLGRAHPETVRR